jgi:hypothetical protein
VSSGIFFSYRRFTDGFAERLRTSLGAIYRADCLSMDSEIEPGEDFGLWLKRRIASSDVMLVILGPGWATVVDDHGDRRLCDEHDYARIEIEEGLLCGVPIIPVLVGNAKLPTAAELPDSISQLASTDAIEFRDECWDDDLSRLITVIERQTDERLPKIAPGTPPPS